MNHQAQDAPAASARQTMPLVDLRGWPLRWQREGVFLLFAAWLLLVLLTNTAGAVIGLGALLLYLGVVGVCAIRQRFRDERLLADAIDNCGIAALPVLLSTDAALNKAAYRLTIGLSSLPRIIAERGGWGMSFRILSERHGITEVHPFAFSFEPLVLNGRRDEFLELSRQSGDGPSGAAGATDCHPSFAASCVDRAQATDIGTLSLRLIVVLLLGMLHLAAGGAALVLVGWGIVRSRSMRSQVWIFPGGMMVPAKGKIWRRESSILVCDLRERTLHLQGQQPFSFHLAHVTARESEMALRAWLSEAPSPTDLMLKEYTGMR